VRAKLVGKSNLQETFDRLAIAKFRGEIERRIEPEFNRYKNRELSKGQLLTLLARVTCVLGQYQFGKKARPAAVEIIKHAAPQYGIKMMALEEKKEEGGGDDEHAG